jgi:hypothetical protein
MTQSIKSEKDTKKRREAEEGRAEKLPNLDPGSSNRNISQRCQRD